MVRKRNFKVIIKLTQEALKKSSIENTWVNLPVVVDQIKSLEPTLDIEAYGYESIETAIKSINGGWVEFKDNKIKLGKQVV